MGRWFAPRLAARLLGGWPVRHGRLVAGRGRRRSHKAVPTITIATADAIVAISQAGAVVSLGFGTAPGAGAAGTEAAELRADGSEAPAGMPSRVRVAVSCGVPRSHPVACSGW